MTCTFGISKSNAELDINFNREKYMNEQDRLNNKYMTGWEIIKATIMFALVIATTYLILLIGG